LKLTQVYRAALIANSRISDGSDVPHGTCRSGEPSSEVRNIVMFTEAWAMDQAGPSDSAASSQGIACGRGAESKRWLTMVAATKRASIADAPVLLVGHSTEEWLSRRQETIKSSRVGVCAALAPSEGESVASVTKPFPPAPLGAKSGRMLRFSDVTPKGIAEDFAQESDRQGETDY